MTRFGKLVLIGVLAGTLGLIGCGSDDGGSGGGTAGSGGSAGSGGTAGDGGNGGGGEGGTGGGGETAACGEGEEIDDSYTIAEGVVSCDALGAITVPVIVRLGAKSDDLTGDTADVDVRVSLDLDEATVGMLGALVQTAVIGEASGDVFDVPATEGVNVPATVPCAIDFTADPDDNGMAGPIIVTTPAEVQTWPTVDGSIVVEVSDITFDITQPVPLQLTTKGEDAPCSFTTTPTVTLPPAM